MPQQEFREASTIAIPGELELLHVVGAPPVRPNTPLTLAVIANRNEMAISFCIDPQIVADQDCNDLIQICMEQFRQSANDFENSSFPQNHFPE